MSSVAIAVPPVITEWCIAAAWFPTWNRTTEGRYHCGNSSRGLPEKDFQSICCPGTITNLKFPIFKDVFSGGNSKLNMDDLVCCPGAAGLADATTCSSSGPGAEPTPLASYAATDTYKAELFEATYPGASQAPGTLPPGNMILTQVPYCIWMYTGNGTQMSTVSLPAPVFTTTITPLGGWGYDGTASAMSQRSPTSTVSSSASTHTQSSTSPLPTTSAAQKSSSNGAPAAATTTTTSAGSRRGKAWNGRALAFLAVLSVALVR